MHSPAAGWQKEAQRRKAEYLRVGVGPIDDALHSMIDDQRAFPVKRNVDVRIFPFRQTFLKSRIFLRTWSGHA